MDCDLSWLVGRTLGRIESLGHGSWAFHFGDAEAIRVQCPWRVVRDGGIVLSSEDDGHRYGLPRPVDAEAACRSEIGGAIIRSAAVRGETRDILLEFASGVRLEVIPLSSGYESWQIVGPDGRFTVAQGGGGLAIWSGDVP